jgi:eukaryotic-like serine/threonine-protein kinase
MGEVYRAKDSRLKREVALKILPSDVVADRERLARFQREAEVLASLNHMNIAQVYGLEGALAGGEASGLCGTTALAMELVEGEDLAQRIARGHLPVDEALAIAAQIAAALEAAHERGIIHRDLKPANVKLRPDGMVKLLDFGLAKAIERSDGTAVADVTNTPTLTSPARTMQGMILGTAAYMAPEQAKGKPVDQRADIWAFGCVLFEMLTGQRAFGGDDVTDTITSVLRDTPDLSKLPAEVPPHVRSALQSCLEKDAQRRWRSIGDVQLLLGGQVDLGVAASAPSSTRSAAGWRMKAALVFLTALTIALAVTVMIVRRPAGARPVARFGLALPAEEVSRELAITPDGSKVIFVGDRGRRLYVRSLDALDPVEIATGVVLGQTAISPDGRWVSFIDESTKLRKVPISGGPATGIANLDGGARGIAWLTNDTLVVGTAASSGLLRVSASGAEPPTPITTPGGGVDHLWPAALPGRRAVLFSIEGTASGDEDQQVAVLDTDTGRMSVVVGGGGRPRFVADGTNGYLAYAARGKTYAVPFDAADLEVPSEATPVDLGLQPGTFAVSAEGTLVYRTGNETGDDGRRTLVWVDRSGRETRIAAQSRPYQYPQIAPDGARAAVSDLGDRGDLWIWQFGATTLTRFTLEPSAETTPIWTPDGKRLVFASKALFMIV